MPPKREAYREKLQATLNDVIALLKASKTTDRKNGLDQLEDIFKHDQAIENIEPPNAGGKIWLAVFQAVFQAIYEERRSYLVKPTTTSENKLAAAASRLRWLTSRTLLRITKKVLTALCNHLVQCVQDRGQLVRPLAKDYTATLRLILSYPPHLDHITQDSWVEIVVFSFAGLLGDPIPQKLEWTSDDAKDVQESSELSESEDGTTSRKRPRLKSPAASRNGSMQSILRPLSAEQIELMAVIRLLLKAPNAPLFSQADVDNSDTDLFLIPRIILAKLLNFFRLFITETSAHQDAVLALSELLTQLEFNAREILIPFTVRAMPDLLSLWRSTSVSRKKTMKEGLLVCIRTLLPFLLLIDQDLVADSTADLGTVCRSLEEGMSGNGWTLPLECVRLAFSGPRHSSGAFVTRTFRHGFNFDSHHAFVWCVLELQADCLFQYLRTRLPASLHESLEQSPKKRKNLHAEIRGDPLQELLRNASRGATPEVRLHSLQLILFLIERHWTSLTPDQASTILKDLLQLLQHDDLVVQSFAFLSFASLAALSPNSTTLPSPLKPEWTTVWTVALRRVGSPEVCRTACHALHALLDKNLIEPNQAVKDIEHLSNELGVQGPSQPYDAVCGFLSAALRLANQNIRTHQLGLGDRVLGWFMECWSSAEPWGIRRPLVEQYAVKDLLGLFEAICALSPSEPASCRIPLPDCAIVEWSVERRRTEVIRRYFFDSYLPPFNWDAPTLQLPSTSLAMSTMSNVVGPSQLTGTQGEHGMPSLIATKCTKYLLKCLDQLCVLWDTPPDIRMMQASQVRSALEMASLSLLFETSLTLNGIRFNIKVGRKSYELIVRLLETVGTRPWPSRDKATILTALDPLVMVNRGGQVFEALEFEAMVKPGRGSGMTRAQMMILQRQAEVEASDVASNTLHVLWEQLQKCVDVKDIISTAKNLLLAFGSEGALQTSDTIDDDNFASQDAYTPNERAVASPQTSHRALATWVSSCFSLMSTPARCLSLVAEMKESTEAVLEFMFPEGQEERSIQLGQVLFDSISRKDLPITLPDIAPSLDWLNVLLKSYTYQFNEAMLLFVVGFLRATLDLWINIDPAGSPSTDAELASDVKDVCTWLVDFSLAGKITSWRVREAVASFLGACIVRDPHQTFLKSERIKEEGDEEVAINENTFPGNAILASLVGDTDARVRFRTATVNALAMDAVINAGLVQGATVYMEILQRHCSLLERFEHMLTRFLSLGNFVIIGSSIRRAPYWHLLEAVFHVDTYLAHIEAVLDSCAARVGLGSRGALFQVFAASIAKTTSRPHSEFMRLPPAVLGFKNRSDLVLQSFPLIAPTYTRELADPTTLFEQRFAAEYLERTGRSPEEALSEIFPDVLALRVTFAIDELTKNQSTSLVLSESEDRALEEGLLALAAACKPENARDFIREAWDRIAFGILKLFDGMDCSRTGTIFLALRGVEDQEAAGHFLALTKYRREDDFLVHSPNPPTMSPVTVTRALKRMEAFVAQRSAEVKTKFSQSAAIYHIIYQLLAAINSTPLMNERFRLLNALCFHIARSYRKAAKDYTLIRALAFGATTLLGHYDLAHAAQSIIEWCLQRYRTLPAQHLVGLSTVLIRVGQIAADYASNKNDEEVRHVGEELLDWVEQWMSTSPTEELKPHITAALVVWPRKLPSLPMLSQESTQDSLYKTLYDPSMAAGRFRAVRPLRDLVVNGGSTGQGLDDFWTLKASIPSIETLQPEDVDAFLELLFLGAGRVLTVPDEPLTTRSLAMRHILNGNPFPPPKEYLVLTLHSILTSQSMHSVELAYKTLRAVLSAGFSAPKIQDHQAPAVYLEVKLLSVFRLHLPPPTPRSLNELLEPEHQSTCQNFDDWITSTTLLFSSVLSGHDPFYGQLSTVLSSDVQFAEEALPILTRCLLESAPLTSPQSPRPILSQYFTSVLKRADTHIACRRSIIHLILHLRHFTPTTLASPLAYNQWLDLDYFLLAQAATACGSYTTAILFLELAVEEKSDAERDQMFIDAEDMLYTIYDHIEEPDGFYGVKSQDVRKFLIRRFHHEAQWDKAFQFHGAAYETSSSATADAQQEIVGALHNFGFDKLAMQVFSAPASQRETRDTSQLAYTLGWKTETWDLPVVEESRNPSATLYAALQAVHRQREPEAVERKLSTLLQQELYRLSTIGNEDMTGIQESIRLLLSLGELRRCRLLDPDAFYSMSDADPVASHFEFQNIESVMATRISCIRSRRMQEESNQMGDIATPTMLALSQAEFSSLLKLAQAARSNNRVQLALNSLQQAQTLVNDSVSSFELESEFASVLWLQGEQTIAVEHLRTVMRSVADDPRIIRQRPALLSQLGEWVSQAALMKPVEIQSEYFDKALEIEKSATPPPSSLPSSSTEKGKVVHRFASFCEQQYLASIRSPEATYLKHMCEDLQQDVVQLEAGIKGIPSGSREWKQFERQLKKSREELEQYKAKLKTHVDDSATFLRLAIDNFAKSLSYMTTGDEIDTVIRIGALWFSNFKDDQLNAYLADQQSLRIIPSHKLLFISHQLSSRLSEEVHIGQKTLKRILQQLCSRHIFHTFYQLFSVSRGSNAAASTSRRTSRNVPEEPQGDQDRLLAAKALLDKVRASPETSQRVADMSNVCEAYLDWAKYRLDKAKSGVELEIPVSAPIRQLRDVNVPIATDTLVPDPTSKYEDFVSIQCYDPKFTTAGGINLPKITRCIGSDGQTRTQLFKGQGDDDMRQDAVMEQVFELVNYLLSRDQQTSKRRLCVRTYKVIPLAPQAGIIEFVPHTKPLKAWLDYAHPHYRARDIPELDVARRMAAARQGGQDLVAAYNKVCSRLKPVMRHFFTEASKLPMGWFDMRLNYARSVATNSIVGHMIGLGDRHTSNILLQEQTGEVVHIDLGIAFDQGRQLAIPELVPFRLTRDMVDGLGSSGVEGVFRRCAEETLRVLRKDSNVIMTVLGVFKTDPLYSWTVHPLKLRRKQQENLTGNNTNATRTTNDTNVTVDNGVDNRQRDTDTAEKLAERALASVERKLDNRLSVSHDVQELISQATDVSNLAHIYYGWRPWL